VPDTRLAVANVRVERNSAQVRHDGASQTTRRSGAIGFKNKPKYRLGYRRTRNSGTGLDEHCSIADGGDQLGRVPIFEG
ncbi:MAG: hypothetical protein MUF25_24005, partial [Pirellulaceae bacterium]|nr:hypothetical protein [Pirellulaceae bacterium]